MERTLCIAVYPHSGIIAVFLLQMIHVTLKDEIRLIFPGLLDQRKQGLIKRDRIDAAKYAQIRL